MESKSWVFTEHREIVFKADMKWSQTDAMAVTFSEDHQGMAGLIVSDAVTRSARPIDPEEVES